MTRTPSNLGAHEIIGLECEVVESLDPTLRGLRGRVIDETMNLIAVEAAGKALRVPKVVATLSFKLPSGVTVTIRGRDLRFRPEDRVSKVRV